MWIRRPHCILSILILALLCAGCTTSTAVDRAAQSRRQSPRYDADSQRKSPPAHFTGQVVAVEDGDTIVVLDDANGTYKIRLQGIDAPEEGQSFGDRSGQSLSEMASGKQVEIEWSKRLCPKSLSNRDLFGQVKQFSCKSHFRNGSLSVQRVYQTDRRVRTATAILPHYVSHLDSRSNCEGMGSD